MTVLRRRSARPILALCLPALAVLVALAASPAGSALAQAEPDGRISGSVTLATAGAELEPAEVEVIVLATDGVAGTVTAPVVDGRYEVAVNVDEAITYIPRLEYGGVQYFANPVVLTPAAPEASGDFTVYATTSEAPDLRITETAITVVALNRSTGELGILREDLVQNPLDRAFIGDGRGITLRLPVPDGTVDADGENVDGRFTLEDGVLATTTPVRAAAETSIVTRYLVRYDPVEDAYTLRITAPLATDRILLRIPEDYVRALRLPDGASEGAPEQVTLADGAVVTLRTVVMEAVPVGGSLVVVLDGFAPRVNENVLTSRTNAIAAVVVALAVIGGAYLATRARTTRGERSGSAEVSP